MGSSVSENALATAANLLATPVAAADQADAASEHSFEFHGDEREYFRIWIVNLALSIVTLGIYSAWAKVRTQRYFYANTRLAGVPFEYLARPLPILKGRMIAFTLFASYVLASHFSWRLQLLLAGVIVLLSPWLIVRGLMFRARYSSWRGLTFRFVANYAAAFRCYLLIYLLLPLTLGLIFPYIKWRQKQFTVTHHRFGGRAFAFSATSGDFYVPYAIALALLIVWWVVIVSGVAGIAFNSTGARAGMPSLWWIYGISAFVYFGYFLIWVYLAARIANLTYNGADLDGYRLRSSLQARELLGLYLTNTLAVLVSLGLLIPWAMIRMARYRAARMVLLAPRNLDDFHAESQRDESALGAEIDHFFDMDIGL